MGRPIRRADAGGSTESDVAPAGDAAAWADRAPGEAFVDAAGRLRRSCRRCGNAIAYASHGTRRYCTAKCARADAKARRQADPAKLAADRRASRDANRRARLTADGRERMNASQRRYLERKRAAATTAAAREEEAPDQ